MARSYSSYVNSNSVYFLTRYRELTYFTLADGVDLKGDEAGWIQGTTIEKPGGWSIVSVDVFHQLHCLVREKSRDGADQNEKPQVKNLLSLSRIFFGRPCGQITTQSMTRNPHTRSIFVSHQKSGDKKIHQAHTYMQTIVLIISGKR